MKHSILWTFNWYFLFLYLFVLKYWLQLQLSLSHLNLLMNKWYWDPCQISGCRTVQANIKDGTNHWLAAWKKQMKQEIFFIHFLLQMAQYANPNQFGAPMGDNDGGYMEQVKYS